MTALELDRQIPKRGDQRQMEPWQRIGTYAAGLALESAGVKGDAALLARMDMIVAAGGGERDYAVDGQILSALPGQPDPGAYLNEHLMADLRPTLFLAQLSNLLAGNISIVHGVVGSSRTFMGEEAAGTDAIRIACARIGAGQSDLCLVGGSFNAERPDAILHYAMGGPADPRAIHADLAAPDNSAWPSPSARSAASWSSRAGSTPWRAVPGPTPAYPACAPTAADAGPARRPPMPKRSLHRSPPRVTAPPCSPAPRAPPCRRRKKPPSSPSSACRSAPSPAPSATAWSHPFPPPSPLAPWRSCTAACFPPLDAAEATDAGRALERSGNLLGQLARRGDGATHRALTRRPKCPRAISTATAAPSSS